MSKQLQTKLVRVMERSGLSWAKYSGLIEIADYVGPFPVDTAMWYYDRVAKVEKIAVSSELMRKLPVNALVMVIKHELLHKAMFRGMEDADNFAVANLALDAAINKILYLSHPYDCICAWELIYTMERNGPLAVANSSINREEHDEMAANIRKLFDRIYMEVPDGKLPKEIFTAAKIARWHIRNTEVPDPLTLYYELANILSKKQKKEVKENYSKKGGSGKGSGCPSPNGQSGGNQSESDESDNNKDDNKKGEVKDKAANNGNEEQNKQRAEETNKEGNKAQSEPQRYYPRGGEERLRDNSKKTIESEADFANSFAKGGGHSTVRNLSEVFSNYVAGLKVVETKGMKEFVSKWSTMRQVEGTEAMIQSDIVSQPRWDPYPDKLTRTGMEYVVLDVSGPDEIPLYINEADPLACKKKAACYFDVSPSMNTAIPFMAHIAEFMHGLDEVEMAGGEFNGRYKFAGDVAGIQLAEWEEFKKGNVHGGYSTCFDSVIEHALKFINNNDCDIIAIFTDGESSLSKENIEAFNASGKTCYKVYFTYEGRERYKTNLEELNGLSFDIAYKA